MIQSGWGQATQRVGEGAGDKDINQNRVTLRPRRPRSVRNAGNPQHPHCDSYRRTSQFLQSTHKADFLTARPACTPSNVSPQSSMSSTRCMTPSWWSRDSAGGAAPPPQSPTPPR